MGMAASQARYLGLSARKTNIEFEGQQVNQQRTALANESAGLFRRMLSLDVPTAPSKTDYQTQIYTYSEPLSSDGKATVTSIELNDGSDPETYSVSVKYNIDALQYGYQPNQDISLFEDSDKNLKIQLANGQVYNLESTSVSEDLVKNLNEAGATSYSKDDKYYTFYNSASKCKYYINATATGLDVEELNVTQNIDWNTAIQTTEQVNKTLNNVTMAKADSGIYTSMYWTDEYGISQNRSLAVGEEYDDAAYDAAMHQYNADKAAYEKEIADINAKTEELQETDRTLELRLKQLDTEQQALQTEMESVKKVIDKQIETVFKTFQ